MYMFSLGMKIPDLEFFTKKSRKKEARQKWQQICPLQPPLPGRSPGILPQITSEEALDASLKEEVLNAFNLSINKRDQLSHHFFVN